MFIRRTFLKHININFFIYRMDRQAYQEDTTEETLDINSQPIDKPILYEEEEEEELMPYTDQHKSYEINVEGKPNGAIHSERYTKHLERIQTKLKTCTTCRNMNGNGQLPFLAKFMKPCTHRKKKVKVRPVPPIMMQLLHTKVELLLYRSEQKRVSLQHYYEISQRVNN